MHGVLIKRENVDTDRHAQMKDDVMTSRKEHERWRTSQGVPKTSGNLPESREKHGSDAPTSQSSK